jgi:riboflavin synthase
MFTGLIQGLGTLKSLGTEQLQITIANPSVSELILPDLAIGDSVAVDGVCLTVETILPQGFIASASPETLKRTTLGRQENSWVNLETSLRVGSKIGGHFVSGHVDSIGCLQEVVQTANSWEITFTSGDSRNGSASRHPRQHLWQQQIAPYIVSKGSIAVNGISLTVADCDPDSRWFKVAVIPHTYEQTNLKYLVPGSSVNLESDILAKYAVKFISSSIGALAARSAGSAQWSERAETTANMADFDEITPAFLAENGFL